MHDSKILLAVVVVAVLALIGRILINKNKDNDTVNIPKLLSIALAVVCFVTGFMLFNPQRFMMWYEGEASLSDAQNGCIAGRKAARDINRFAGPSDDTGDLYYALQVKSLVPTGYFRIKKTYMSNADVERKVEETESNKEIIRHTTNVFPITRNPGDKADLYIPLYLAKLANKGAALVAIDESDVPSGIVDSDNSSTDVVELPIAMMRLTDDRLHDIALKTDSTAMSDIYFVAFDEDRYAHNEMNYYLHKGIAGLIGAIIVALIYLVFARFNRKGKKIEK
ncbi:MAG: hypothetical protein MJZ15_08855 [Bacteroidales bacterium]|nr:hypothetical protein [Bacteroidales bacterium]